MELKEQYIFLHDMIRTCYPVACWVYTRSGDLVWTDCEQPSLRALLEKSDEFHVLLTHESSAPLIVGNLLGTLWGAVFGNKENDAQIYLLGPILNAALSDKQIKEAAHRLVQDPSQFDVFQTIMESLPVVPLTTLQNFILMIHRCVTGDVVEPSDIQYQQQKAPVKQGLKMENKDRNQTYMAERQLLYHVREGDMNYKQAQVRAASVSAGLGVSTREPIRQAILSVTIFTSLCTRAAIEGGLSPDTAYTVGDAYIQSILSSGNIAQLRELSHRMYEDFILRVHRARIQSCGSKTIRDCCEYIQLHPEEELSISSLAQRFGYTNYYFSKKFKREIGESVTDYIDVVRVERAKMLLETTNIPIAEMAEAMHYCSSTHFSNTFRNYVGKLPTEYRKQFR